MIRNDRWVNALRRYDRHHPTYWRCVRMNVKSGITSSRLYYRPLCSHIVKKG